MSARVYEHQGVAVNLPQRQAGFLKALISDQEKRSYKSWNIEDASLYTERKISKVQPECTEKMCRARNY